MRERVAVITLSVCHSICVSFFYFGEGTVFRFETYLGDDLSPLNVAFFLKIEAILEKKRVELQP